MPLLHSCATMLIVVRGMKLKWDIVWQAHIPAKKDRLGEHDQAWLHHCVFCREQVLLDLGPHIIDLSRDKFASNVVERCLKHGSATQRRSIIQEFLQNETALIAMMRDDYGNYVCYSAFEVCCMLL